MTTSREVEQKEAVSQLKPLPRKMLRDFERRLRSFAKPFTATRTMLNGAVRVLITGHVDAHGELDLAYEEQQFLPVEGANKALKSLLDAVLDCDPSILDFIAEQEGIFDSLEKEPVFIQKVKELDAITAEVYQLEEQGIYLDPTFGDRPFDSEIFIGDILDQS